jgi:hypothetical protein
MKLLGALLVCSIGAAMLPAQQQTTPSPIENKGQPMRLDFRCGEEDILHFGLTCDENDPCHVFLELSSVESAGTRIFVSGNFHTTSTTLASLLLVSEDGGRSWREPHERVRGAALDQMQFFDLEYGWVSGHTLSPLPRDPFLLTTNDGGKSWRRRPVSNEPKVGAIAQFWFTSRSHGVLLVDRTQTGEGGLRYELFETMTGGDSWAVKQASSSPIREKTFPEARDTGWRIRTDGALRGYRLEHREGERWTTVASFFIAAGECKVKEQQLTEPPPPAESPVFQIPSRPPTANSRPPIG